MRSFRCAFAAILLVFVAGCGGPVEPRSGVQSDDDNPAIDTLFAVWDAPGSPGCALAVAQHGALLYSRGYGYANLDYNIPITPQTVFDVASITKQFNAASLTMLEQDGKLSLDDNVRKWLPELPEFEAPITLRHMIYHTSGLRDYLNLFPLAGRGDYFPISHAQILAMMARQRALIFPPGDQYLYSNTAYMLLAQVVERAGGQPLGEMTRDRIFKPLAMVGSRMYDNFDEIIPQRATGYDRDDEGGMRVVHNYNFDVAGDGQLYSTVEDLLRWDNYLHGTAKPPIYQSMMTEGTLNNGEAIGYAQGIVISDYRGMRTAGHSGSSWGFRSQLVRFVDPGLSIAIACNSDFARPGELAQRVADHYLADQLDPLNLDEEIIVDQTDIDEPLESLSLTAEELAHFAGEFFSAELDANYRFTVIADDLVVHIEQEPPLLVTPVANDRFNIRFYNQGWSGPQTATLEFNRDRSGTVTGFALSSGSERGIVFEKWQRSCPMGKSCSAAPGM